ncbi:MAG: DUF4922 domain-containing protein [Muribaculaceae bacterium]|nr:DUF4922 domain-containing protein [Muribaculaceae bacterium]
MKVPDFLKDFYNRQLAEWPLAANSCKALESIERKPFIVGDLKGYVQYNPSRKVSTLANVNPDAIKKRTCFLCSENRPTEQQSIEIIPGYQLLVNPYPILPYHFTIASESHKPQCFNAETATGLAQKLPGMAVFYNDDGAGASAPDHCHYQAVPMKTLPLINLLDSRWEEGDGGIFNNIMFTLDLPFKIIAGTMPTSLASNWETPINSYFWKSENDKIRFLIIGRKAHRPDFYFLSPPQRRAVSPGAIDMAGVIVTPFEEDFKLISDDEIKEIYSQTGLENNWEHNEK